jgi:hypothetical protein
MGYSGRYHAASLAAVFIALAVGILIGIGLADDVVSSASEELEASLRSDLEAAEGRAGDLEDTLEESEKFGQQILPETLAGRLAGRRVALVGLGEADGELVTAARDAVEAADGELSAVAEIALPPDTEALVDDLPRRFARIRRDPDPAAAIGRAVGAELPGGGPVIEALAPDLFTRFSGDLRGVDAVVVTRSPPDDLDPGAREETAALEGALLSAVERAAPDSAGAELTTADPTTLEPMIEARMPTVDHLDLPAGQVSLVYVLTGVDGNYGVKEEARGYLPDFNRGAVEQP